jgi:hypothetical protein
MHHTASISRMLVAPLTWALLVSLLRPQVRPCPLQTKWFVSALVFCVLVWRHDILAAWCVTGAVLSSGVNKVGCAGNAGAAAAACCQVP